MTPFEAISRLQEILTSYNNISVNNPSSPHREEIRNCAEVFLKIGGKNVVMGSIGLEIFTDMELLEELVRRHSLTNELYI